jgi:aspartyl-tRNA(Asn)/glutamyl-tRNA(Gln) amidotransferase subunit C
MATLDRKEVEQIAQLARLELSESELERLSGELSTILDYMDRLRRLDTGAVEPMTHAIRVELRLREDQAEAPLALEAAIGAAPDTDENCFRVPHIIHTAERE